MANPATGATTSDTSTNPYTGPGAYQAYMAQMAPTNTGTAGQMTDTSGGGSSGDNSWLTSFPWSSAIPTGISLYQAGAATRQGQNLTNSITGAARPQLNLGNATVGQMTGGPSVGGPMGTYISGATGGANELTAAAQQYGTGQLTAAQQQQVQSYASAQKGQVASGLSRSGNLDSSTRMALNQEVDNNTAMLTQSLVNQNLQMAASALQAATGTYNAMLTTSLNQTTLGTNATMNAVKMQLQNDQEVQAIIQQILSGIANNATTASGGQVSKQGGNTPAGQLGTAFGNQLRQWFGGNPTDPNSPAVTDPNQYVWGGGPGGSDYSSGVSTGAPTTPSPQDQGGYAGTGVPQWFDSSGGDGGVSTGD